MKFMNEDRMAILISALALSAVWYQGYIAREALYYSERAYVFPDISKARYNANVSGHFGIMLPFVNSGHTPAEQLRFWAISEFKDGPPFPPGDGLKSGTFTQPTILYPQVPYNQPIYVEGDFNQAILK